MDKNNEFFNSIKNIVDPEVERGINSGDPSMPQKHGVSLFVGQFVDFK